MLRKVSLKVLALALVASLFFTYTAVLAEKNQSVKSDVKTEKVDQKSDMKCAHSKDDAACAKKCADKKSMKGSKKGCCAADKKSCDPSQCKDKSKSTNKTDTK